MRADGLFIAVEVDDRVAADSELARKLTEACPVDIFAQRENGTLEIVQANLDECVLCRLCLDDLERAVLPLAEDVHRAGLGQLARQLGIGGHPLVDLDRDEQPVGSHRVPLPSPAAATLPVR